MMAWRTHQRKSFSTAERQVDRTDRRSCSASGVFFNSWIVGSISIKIDRLPKTLEKFWVMGPQNFIFCCQAWFHPDPVGMPIQKISSVLIINMGALAITTLVGARLILSSKSWAVLHDVQPFIAGFTLFFWATGTWWIPLLVVVGFWRHVIERVPLTYDPQYWSLVFPLGMYTVATFMFANATGMPFLLIIPRVAVYIAMLVWFITFGAMLVELGNFCSAYRRRRFRPQRRTH
jgi:tellurite resistance protein TehA-like permease